MLGVFGWGLRTACCSTGIVREERPVVLALSRGGVPLGAEVANSLAAPLNLVLVRKIGVPEFAMGTVAEGSPPLTVSNERIVHALRIDDSEFNTERDRELIEIERRRRTYLGDRPRIDVAGRVAIDDGIATGMTTRAAARAITNRGPRQVVIAAPVANTDIAVELRREIDDVILLEEHEHLYAIGLHYADFSPVSDEEVRQLLSGDLTAAD